jgi:hypothetical protein
MVVVVKRIGASESILYKEWKHTECVAYNVN